MTAFFGDFDRDGFELERDLRSCLTILESINHNDSVLFVPNYRFWAGETCFEDFDGFESLDLDLPLRTDSDFLKKKI